MTDVSYSSCLEGGACDSREGKSWGATPTHHTMCSKVLARPPSRALGSESECGSISLNRDFSWSGALTLEMCALCGPGVPAPLCSVGWEELAGVGTGFSLQF